MKKNHTLDGSRNSANQLLYDLNIPLFTGALYIPGGPGFLPPTVCSLCLLFVERDDSLSFHDSSVAAIWGVTSLISG